MNIPFSRAFTPEGTIEAIQDVLDSGKMSGNGPVSARVQELIRYRVGGSPTFLTASCTQALEMATLLLKLSPGDEVIIPSFTFTSAITSLVNFGVVPVFVDVQLDDFNIDINRIQSAITSKTKAISVVNYAGFGCDYSSLLTIKEEYGLFLIEDNAHGLGGESQNRHLGSFGDISTLSFHATKNFQCGEGGSITINNSQLLDRVEVLREKGTDRTRFLLGEVEKYQWIDQGGSFLQAEVLSAILEKQFHSFDQIQSKRDYIWNKYWAELAELCFSAKIRIPQLIKNTKHTSHIFYLLFHKEEAAESFLRQVNSEGVQATRHYQPLHSSIGGKKYGKVSGTFEIAEKLGTSLIRLPIWHQMSDLELDYVLEVVKRAITA